MLNSGDLNMRRPSITSGKTRSFLLLGKEVDLCPVASQASLSGLGCVSIW